MRLVGAQWTFLSDTERKVQKDLASRSTPTPEHNPMGPAYARAQAWAS